jgi:protein-S-isoprenylcysteine O-methyltransferase Ste14
MPLWVETAGAVSILASYAFLCRVLAEKTFRSPVVRIQAEHAQCIITTGPYASVRHPMYGGAIPFLLETLLLLGSCYGLVFVRAGARTAATNPELFKTGPSVSVELA